MSVFADGLPYLTVTPEMTDYAARIWDMDKAGVDVAIVSLSAQNCYFGSEEVELGAARLVNDDMAEQQRIYPDRIRWFASLRGKTPIQRLRSWNGV